MTLTKEWLLTTIAELEEERDATPGVVNEDAAKALVAMKLAMASLEAEPVALRDERSGSGGISKKPGFNDLQHGTPLYTAPPAPVSVPDYPEILPCPVMLEPGLRFGKGVTTRTMLGALQRRAGHCTELEAMTPEQRAEHEAGMKEFAAMLQGAEHVSNRDELPLGYLQGHKDGLEWAAQLAEANHPQTGDWLYDDPIALASAIRKGPDMPELKSAFADEEDNFYSWFGRFWLENYQQNNYTTSAKQMLGTMAEFAFRAGRESATQDGKSPVIPDGWVMVPVEPTEKMIIEGFESEPDEFFSDAELWGAYNAMSGCQQAAHRAHLCYAAMLAAAPAAPEQEV